MINKNAILTYKISIRGLGEIEVTAREMERINDAKDIYSRSRKDTRIELVNGDIFMVSGYQWAKPLSRKVESVDYKWVCYDEYKQMFENGYDKEEAKNRSSYSIDIAECDCMKAEREEYGKKLEEEYENSPYKGDFNFITWLKKVKQKQQISKLDFNF